QAHLRSAHSGLRDMARDLSREHRGSEAVAGLRHPPRAHLHFQSRVVSWTLPPLCPLTSFAARFSPPTARPAFGPSAAEAFLQACETDGIEVLGWEAWIVHHRWDFDANWPRPAYGSWCGLFPTESHGELVGGTGDAGAARREIAEFTLEPGWAWREFV